MTNAVVKIENREGQLVVTSRQVAKELGREHKNVIRDLEKILESSNVSSLIIPSLYKVDGQTRTYKEYLLTKDGFTLYMFNIQGYNEFKLAYINEFNRMEQALRNNVPQITQEQQLVLSIYNGGVEAIESTKQLIELKTKPLLDKIETQAPKVLTYDAVFDDRYYDARQLASMLNVKGMGRNNLLAFLREKEMLDKHNIPLRKYVDAGYCKQVPTNKFDMFGNPVMKTMFSDKVLQRLIKYFNQ